MAIPDFNYKPDNAIIQAFQNASAQRQNAEAEQRRVDLAEKQQQFNMVKDTATAVGSMVKGFVEEAEKRKTEQVFNKDLKTALAPRKETIPVEGPTQPIIGPQKQGAMELQPAQQVPNPNLAAEDIAKKEALGRIARVIGKDALGEQAAKALFADSPSNKLTMATRSTPMALQLPNGDNVLGFYDPTASEAERFKLQDGTPAPQGTQRSYKDTITTDPSTNELVRVNQVGGAKPLSSAVEKTEIMDPLELNVRQSNRLEELKKQYTDDDLVKTNRLNLQTLNNLKTVSAEGAGALIGALQSLRARGVAGEKGVLTEQDVMRTTGSPALARRFSNAWNKLIHGQEDPQNLAEFKSAIEAVENMATKRNQKIESDYIKRARSTKELANVSEELIRKNITIGTEAFEEPAAKPTAAKPGGIKSLDDARKLSPEALKKRIAELEAQR